MKKRDCPTLEEFREMQKKFHTGHEFPEVMAEYSISKKSEFYNWWNFYYGETEDDELKEFTIRFSKLGRLLNEVKK